MDVGDREPGVADCIFSPVVAVSHVSAVTSHPPSEGAGFNLTQRVHVTASFPALQSKGVPIPGRNEGVRRGSPAADDEGADENDEEDHAAHHRHQQHCGVGSIADNGCRDWGEIRRREEGELA